MAGLGSVEAGQVFLGHYRVQTPPLRRPYPWPRGPVRRWGSLQLLVAPVAPAAPAAPAAPVALVALVAPVAPQWFQWFQCLQWLQWLQ